MGLHLESETFAHNPGNCSSSLPQYNTLASCKQRHESTAVFCTPSVCCVGGEVMSGPMRTVLCFQRVQGPQSGNLVMNEEMPGQPQWQRLCCVRIDLSVPRTETGSTAEQKENSNPLCELPSLTSDHRMYHQCRDTQMCAQEIIWGHARSCEGSEIRLIC